VSFPRGVRWIRARERSGWLLLAAVLLATGGAVVGQLKGPLWVLAVLAGLAAAGPLVVERLQSRRKELDDRTDVLERTARGFTRKGRLPLVREVDLVDDLDVHRPVVEIGYVDRDLEAIATQALAEHRPLLVVGHSMAGKSRMAAELIRRLYPDVPIFLPDAGTALTELAAAGAILEKAVVWLNELDEFLTASGLTVGLLDRLLARENTVVATMTTSAYDKFRPTSDYRPKGADVIEQFEMLRLDLRMTDVERSKLARQIDDPTVLAAVERYGLTEYVGGGHLALDRYLSGQSVEPIAVAWIRAAADWRRAGLIENIPEPVARGLLKHYLPSHRIGDLAEPEAAMIGLRWARKRVNETVALLYSVDGRLEVFDYVLDHLQHEDLPVPGATWDAIAEAVADAPDDAYRVGMGVFGDDGLETQSERFLRIAAENGNEEAMVWLSMVLTSRGEAEESEHWLSRSHQHDSTTGAMLNLGSLFRALGDQTRAERWYRQAAEAGGPYAMYVLGALLAEQNRLEEAEYWYRKAIGNRGDNALIGLGVLVYQRGDLAEAEELFRRAAERGDSMGVQNLTAVLVERGAEDEAERWLREQASVDNLDAVYVLAQFLAERGNEPVSVAFLRQAAEGGHLEAMEELGGLRYKQNDREEAEQWFRRAAERGVATAGYNLAIVLMERDALAESEQAFRELADLTEPSVMSAFGALLTETDRLDEAERWFRRAADAGDVGGMFNLGVLANKLGDDAEAEHWFQLAADHGHPEAATNLASLQQPDPPTET